MLGDKIREKRESTIIKGKPMSVYKLAQKSGVPHSRIFDIENNKTPNVSFVRIVKLCRVLKLSLNELAKEVQ